MCKARCSESGKLLSISPCNWYQKLESELKATKAALVVAQLRCGDIDVKNKRFSEHREFLFDVVDNLIRDNEVLATRNVNLCQERDSMEALKDEIIRERDVAERALELIRQERDALLKVREAADKLAKSVDALELGNFNKFVPNDDAEYVTHTYAMSVKSNLCGYKEARDAG